MTTKVALVTGASSGIGESTARRLTSLGYTVYGAARRTDRLKELSADGVRALAMDVTDDGSMAAGVQRIIGETGRIDVLVNNAGYGSYGAIEDVDIEEGRRQFEVNVFGAMRLAQLVLPYMRAQRSGTIVNITSMGGKLHTPLGGWYHGTKFALEALSDCLRMEVAPFGIDVVVIEPGGIATEWGGIAADHLDKTGGSGAYATVGRRRHVPALGGQCQPQLAALGDRRRDREGGDRPATQDAVRRRLRGQALDRRSRAAHRPSVRRPDRPRDRAAAQLTQTPGFAEPRCHGAGASPPTPRRAPKHPRPELRPRDEPLLARCTTQTTTGTCAYQARSYSSPTALGATGRTREATGQVWTVASGCVPKISPAAGTRAATCRTPARRGRGPGAPTHARLRRGSIPRRRSSDSRAGAPSPSPHLGNLLHHRTIAPRTLDGAVLR